MRSNVFTFYSVGVTSKMAMVKSGWLHRQSEYPDTLKEKHECLTSTVMDLLVFML